MAKAKILPQEEVTQFIETSTHPLKDVMQALREILLSADASVGEHIKWNSPAFYYTGAMADFDPKEYKRDIVVYNLRKPTEILLVFPSGARVTDATGLLTGNYADGRKLATITGIQDLEAKKQALQTVIQQWIALIDK
jgi:TATA-box binding protein (TBP) (component of TFIID and TFIIIB)